MKAVMRVIFKIEDTGEVLIDETVTALHYGALRTMIESLSARALDVLQRRMEEERWNVQRQAEEAEAAAAAAATAKVPPEPAKTELTEEQKGLLDRMADDAAQQAERIALASKGVEFGRRTINGLTYNAIDFNKLITMTRAELLQLPHIGVSVCEDIEQQLAAFGIYLPGSSPATVEPVQEGQNATEDGSA